MTKEDEVLLERRLTTLEMGIEEVKRNSDERLAVLLARFDKIDRRAGWLVTTIFGVCLTFGGIYLEYFLNKEETVVKPVTVVSTDAGM